MDNIAIVTTSIKVPYNLIPLSECIKKYKNIKVIIVGDNISKDIEDNIINKIYCNKNDNFIYYKYIEQYKDFSNYIDKDNFDKIIPNNSIQRRNVGFLKAIKDNFDYIISIDDDNFPINLDWIFNLINYKKLSFNLIPSKKDNYWVDLLNYYFKVQIRGIPYVFKPENINFVSAMNISTNDIIVHQGLSLGDPDRSSLHRYIYPDLYLNNSNIVDNIILDKNVWSPFNTQNIIFSKSVFPALFLIPMKCKVNDNYFIDRYDDIIMSYIITKIAHHLNKYISFGNPLSIQYRNSHNLLKDLEGETIGIVIGDIIISMLYKIELHGNNFIDCYKEIAISLNKLSHNYKDWCYSFINSMSNNMIIWINLIKQIYKE